MRVYSIIKTLISLSFVAFSSPSSGLRLFGFGLKSDSKVVGSKYSMHLNLGLYFWYVGWWFVNNCTDLLITCFSDCVAMYGDGISTFDYVFCFY